MPNSRISAVHFFLQLTSNSFRSRRVHCLEFLFNSKKLFSQLTAKTTSEIAISRMRPRIVFGQSIDCHFMVRNDKHDKNLISMPRHFHFIVSVRELPLNKRDDQRCYQCSTQNKHVNSLSILVSIKFRYFGEKSNE